MNNQPDTTQMPDIQAVLFDLDGTLLDTAPDLVVAVNALRHDYGLGDLSADRIINMVGKGTPNLIDRVLTYEHSLVYDHEVAYRQFAQHYHACNGQLTQAYQTVDAVLHQLHDRGYPLGIVTNKPSEFTLPLITEMGWHTLFGVIVCGDSTPIKKPAPEPIWYACTQLKVPAPYTLMIGDSMNDAIAAQAAGCHCAMVTYGYNEGQPLSEGLKTMANITAYSTMAEAIGSWIAL